MQNLLCMKQHFGKVVLVRKKRLFRLCCKSKYYDTAFSIVCLVAGVTAQLKVILILRYRIEKLEGGAGHPGSGLLVSLWVLKLSFQNHCFRLLQLVFASASLFFFFSLGTVLWIIMRAMWTLIYFFSFESKWDSYISYCMKVIPYAIWAAQNCIRFPANYVIIFFVLHKITNLGILSVVRQYKTTVLSSCLWVVS